MTTPLPPDAAREALGVAQATARLLRRSVVVALPKRRRLRVTYTPNLSYGRYNPPAAGAEAFEYEYSVWSSAASMEDVLAGHVRDEARGWRGVHDGEAGALALLQGAEPDETLSEGRELAARFGGAS